MAIELWMEIVILLFMILTLVIVIIERTLRKKEKGKEAKNDSKK